MLRLGQLIHGKGVDKKVTAEQPKEMPKPSKEDIMDVFQKFKLSAFNSIDVSPKDEKTVEYLKSLGLVTVVEQHFLNASTGMTERRKTAKWNSWDCSWCVNFYVGDKTVEWGNLGNKATFRNISLCRKGCELQVRDSLTGKRCGSFMPKKLAEALDGD